MLSTSNGFELAEEDLRIRGPGNVLGTQQSGEIVFSFANSLDHNYIKYMSDTCDGIIRCLDRYPTVQLFFEDTCHFMTTQLN